jgi:Ca2+-binding EF-hand superfamily protein
MLGVDTDKYRVEFEKMTQILLEDRPDGVNVEALDRALQWAKNPVSIRTGKRDFTTEELNAIMHKVTEIQTTMKKDNLTFNFFSNKDRGGKGTIPTQDFISIIRDELFLLQDKGLDLLVEYCRDERGDVKLTTLRTQLEPKDATTSKKSLDEFLSLIKQKFQGNIDSILAHYDESGDGNISKREFITGSKKVLPEMDIDELKGLFDQISKNSDSMSILQLKDLLEADLLAKKKFFSSIKEFI